MAPFDEIHAIMAESEEYCGMMIINWYSTHIDLSDLSQRLRIAYALWIASSSPGKLPHLKQIELSHEYEKISPYVALVENQGSAEQPKLTFLTAGSKVVELYGANIAAQRLDDVLTESGQVLAEEVFEALRNESKPVRLSVSGSPIISSDIEAMVMPVLYGDATSELDLLVYDF